jgi:molybdate transport system substrate-binding protein
VKRLWVVGALVVWCVSAPVATAATSKKPVTLLVAGASDLRPAFEEIGKQFTAKTGTKLTFSFGSSGQLAQQVKNGAPFDVFASADVGYVNDVLQAGFGDRTTKATYAYGRLALWTPSTSTVAGLADLSDAALKRIAIANPDHAPYGVAAVEALRSVQVYDAVADRLVFGDNVSDTYRLATSGNADAALVSLSLVIANRNGGRYVVVPAESHKSLEQTLVVTATKKRAPSAKAFVKFVSSPTGRVVMRRFGFLLPGDALPPSN